MKFYLSVVLTLSLIAGGWWGVDAYKRKQQAAEHAQTELVQHRLEEAHLRSVVDADRLAIRNAELDVEIAELEHRKPNQLAVAVAKDRMRADEFLLKTMLDGDESMESIH